jgi:hypothetical protein
MVNPGATMREVGSAVVAPLSTLIQEAVVTYLAADIDKNPSDLWQTCAFECFSAYGYLKLEEVISAIRLCATGQINAQVTTWGGRFSVAQMTDMLRAYCAERQVIRLEASRALDMAKAPSAEDLERQRQEFKEESLRVFFQYKEAAAAGTPFANSWIDLWPVSDLCRIWIESFPDMFPDDQKADVWARSLDITRARVAEELKNANGSGEARSIKTILENPRGDDFMAKRMIIYARMLVWELHLDPMLYVDISL